MLPSSESDAPAWVRADRAAQHAWAHDRQWRKAARSALPPVHRPLGDGGTVGDQLLAQARRNGRREARGGGAKARREAKEDRRHAERCICAPCKKARGEHLPTAQEQRFDRESLRVAGDDWRLSDEPRVVYMKTVDTVFAAAGLSATRSGKMNWCSLRERFIDHLDQQAHHALLSLAEAEPRQARIVICCALLRLRQVDVAQQEGLTHGRVSQLLKEGLAFMRSCVVTDDGAAVALAPQASGERRAASGAGHAP